MRGFGITDVLTALPHRSLYCGFLILMIALLNAPLSHKGRGALLSHPGL
ncbi:MAG: hypothetical protein AB2708_21785 [Candidatus Thiodiazotropha taylori]